MLRVIKSLAVIAGVGVVAFGATRAVWSDSGTATGNTFAAGTLDLQLRDDDEGPADSVSVTWNGSAMTPGGIGAGATLQLQNVGDPTADHVHFAIVNDITEDESLAGAGSDDLIISHLQVTSLTYDGINILNFNLIPDANGNGYMDLEDLEEAGQIGMTTGTLADNPPKLELKDLNVEHPLTMTVALNSDSPDENQGDSVEMTLTATLHQVDGQ